MLDDIKEIVEDSWIKTKGIIIGILTGVVVVLYIKYIVSIASDLITYIVSIAF